MLTRADLALSVSLHRYILCPRWLLEFRGHFYSGYPQGYQVLAGELQCADNGGAMERRAGK